MTIRHGIICKQAEKFVPLILQRNFLFYIIFNSKFSNIPRRIVLKRMYQGDMIYSRRFQLKSLEKSKAFLVLTRPCMRQAP
jgi:hypothetical protein